ncbi:MAG TPA: protease pro-enzyme activation domain-containing protein [Bryobacteraceae bacterium]|nr:protease pro-enzyme activation domain-containing protein [Bryobacteraceae bacterium]
MTRQWRVLLALSLVCTGASAASADRITRPVTSGETVVVKGHVHPAVQARYDRGAVDPAFRMNDIVMLTKPSADQQAELDGLLRDQQNPSSARYHQWLTPEEFGNRFGLTPSDHSKVVAWLESQGFTVHESARGRNWVHFSGTAGQVSHAFHTPIHRIEVNGEKHYANIADPAVPSALADVAGGFLGLNDFNPRSSVKVSMPDYTTGSAHYLAPDDFATIYDVKALYQAGYDGTGQSIAIVGASDLLLSDVQAFRTRYGLPANDPKFMLFGADPGGLSAEGNLDVEWSGAVAPKATIYYVYATSAFTALLDAVNLNIAPVISNSYYSCEGNASPLAYRSVGQQANAQGITILSASGDGGAAGCFDQFTLFATHGPLLQFPASLPEVTAVGGTQFTEGTGTYWATTNSTTFGSALSYIPESAWNESIPGDSIAASAGGPSTMYAKPAWQQGPGVPDDNARDVPDIAMSAAGHDGYYIYYSGSNVIVYGTSASAPAMSGVIAILNQYQVAKGYQKTAGMGNINPQLYRLAQAAPSAFHDIVTGSNMVPCTQGSPGCLTGSYGYLAGPGYDMVTGLGSIDANNFVAQFNVPTRGVTVNLVASAARATLNDSVSLTALVAAATGSGSPTGSVDFSVGTTALGTVALVARGNQMAADISFPTYLFGGTGTYTLYAAYSGDAAFSGGGSRMTITITLPTGVSSIVPSVSNNPVWPSSDSQGLVWQETVRVREAAGVASILTGFTIDGQLQRLSDYFPSPSIPPNTTVSSNPLILRNLASYPVTKTFGFTGFDTTGQTWSVQITALYLPPPETTAGLTPTLVPLTVTQDPGADPSCQWSQQLFLDETRGYSSSFTSLTQGAVGLSTEISAMFGTTRLQAWGSLQGTLCWSGVTPGSSSTVQVGMNSGLSQTLQVTFAGPAANPTKITASPGAISLSADVKAKATASLAVRLADKTQTWSAAVFPANATTTWLQVSQLSGTGTGNLTLTAAGDGFEPGVYRATIVIQSPNAVPAAVNVPVMFVYGSSEGTSIKGTGNAASFQNPASPGMLMSIFGSQLANSTKSASATPLPFVMDGVSVRVNGLDAPIQFISPNQINIQVPYEAGAGPAVLGVNNNGQIAGFQMQIAPTNPGIFAIAPTTIVAGGTATLYLTGDGDIASGMLTGFTPSSSIAAASLPKARQALSVTVGGTPAFLQFYGIPSGLVGITQVNFTIPGSVTPGVQPVVVTVGGVSSPPVNLTVQAPASTVEN